MKPSKLVIALGALLIISFVLWSLWAELDQVTRARGAVIPSGRVQIIQSLEGGVITQILVREGDRVRRGQVLVQLDRVRPAAAVAESQARVAGLRARLARIEAELGNRPIQFPSTVSSFPDLVAAQRNLYSRRRQALNDQVRTMQDMLRLVRSELEMNRPLVASGDVSRSEILRMERTVSDLEGQIANRRNEYFQELQAEYSEVQSELISTEQQLTQRESALSGTELVAPTDGVVVNVRINTVGGVLRAGDEALQIVPTAEELIVEAKVTPTDIASVRAGQRASVKFDAYDSSIYGSADGTVTFVSADTATEETPEGRQAFYRVHLRVNPSVLRPRQPDERIELQPGMTATVEIITGTTTVFQYLTKPLIKTTSEALRER
jgi:adhesin transport system membrane fusion protein